MYSPPATLVLLLFLVFEALLFAIFTAVMLGTQLQAIWNDETVRVVECHLPCRDTSEKVSVTKVGSSIFVVDVRFL
jgi:hypothetical protein